MYEASGVIIVERPTGYVDAVTVYASGQTRKEALANLDQACDEYPGFMYGIAGSTRTWTREEPNE